MNAFEADLAQRRAAHQLRERRVCESPLQPVMRVAGRRLLVFSSDDYLGFANHPRIVDAVRDGVKKWGAGAGASPLINGYCRIHQQLEEEFADFVGRPRALLFPSDYLANLGVMSALSLHTDQILVDQQTHAALAQADSLCGAEVHHLRPLDAESLRARLDRTAVGGTLVVTEGVSAIDGSVAPLAQIAEACDAHSALLTVDDSYGFGVVGETGRGTSEGEDRQPDLLVCALDKALGVGGAVVAGNDVLIETVLQQGPSYRLATALPGALAEGGRVALHLLETEGWRREYVLALTERFKVGAQRLRLPLRDSTTPIQPLVVSSNEVASRFSDALNKAGILVPAIPSPDPSGGSASLRVTLSAAHTTGHVDSLLSALSDVWEHLGDEVE